MKEYIATFKTADQISPDDFCTYNPTLKVTPETTIAEIDQWYRKYHKNGLMQLSIIELELINGGK